jgi:hypothetical protein
MERVHVILFVTAGGYIDVEFAVFRYRTAKETSTIEKGCRWHSVAHTLPFANLWCSRSDENDVRCFLCVPWGNHLISREFERVGTLEFDRTRT